MVKEEPNEYDQERNVLDFYINSGIIKPVECSIVEGELDTDHLRNLDLSQGWKAYDLGKGRYHLEGDFTILWCTIPFEEFYPDPNDENNFHSLYEKPEFRFREYLAVCNVTYSNEIVIYRFRDNMVFNSLTKAINQGYEAEYLPESQRGANVRYMVLSRSFLRVQSDTPPVTQIEDQEDALQVCQAPQ